MGCTTAIPGQTGCLAIRDVKPSNRHKKAAAIKSVVAQKKVAVAIVDEPRFCGGTLEKKNKKTLSSRQDSKNVRAHNDRQHTRPRSFHKSVRKI